MLKEGLPAAIIAAGSGSYEYIAKSLFTRGASLINDKAAYMSPRKKKSTASLRIIPLGGVMEIGKNMTAFVYEEQVLVVDAGLMFPQEEMLGVDIVIPDITFLEEQDDKVLGVVLTHGHEDHIGALPYVLRRLDVPVWGTSLTLGFVKNKLVEHRLDEIARLNVVDPETRLQIGPFEVEYIRMSHSIPDAFGLVIRTPAGTAVMSGDFKFEESPLDGCAIDIERLGEIGDEGVSVLLCDSTNVEKPGFTPSASVVTETFDRLFAEASGRILVAAFASNVHRVQRVYNAAAAVGRRVAVIGRSMEQNCRIAEELGYLQVPAGTRLRLDEIEGLDRDQVVIMTTGSQGEPMSALSRMAMDEHKHVKIEPGDTVIISATPIPGNEDLVMRSINHLFKRGAEVVYEPYANVHVSGHGYQEDIKRMLALIRPKYMVPVHGEQRHYSRFVRLAEGEGYSSEQVFGMHPGDVLELRDGEASVTTKVAAGSVMIDGLGVGDVEDVVLRDRGHLSQDGVVIVVVGIDVNAASIVSGPDIFSRGFIGEDREAELMAEGKERVIAKISEFIESNSLEELDEMKAAVRKGLAKLFYERTHRRPMIVPVMMEV